MVAVIELAFMVVIVAEMAAIAMAIVMRIMMVIMAEAVIYSSLEVLSNHC